MPEKRYYATGKRKTAVARVWIKPGAGQYTINGRAFEDYFPLEEWRLMVNRPFVLTENADKFRLFQDVSFFHNRPPVTESVYWRIFIMLLEKVL